MLRRKRALGLALLALAAPLPAFAVSELTSSSEGQVANLSVSTSLEGCGVLETQLICTLNVSFTALENATSYAATVTRADGSVLEMGAVDPAGSTLYVPYVGSGTYSVRVTAYGNPVEPEAGADDEVDEQVIATGVAETTGDRGHGGRGPETLDVEASAAIEVESEAGPRQGVELQPSGEEAVDATADPNGDAPVETAPESSASCEEPEPLPEEPPEDRDPENLDEDADGILDEDEKLAYEAAVEAREQAAAEAAAAGC